MALQKFPVVIPLGGSVDEGTVTELVQPPRIQSAEDCASVKGGAYQKRDDAQPSNPDSPQPRGISDAPFGVVGVTPDSCHVLQNGEWDRTAGNKGARPGTVNPLQLGTDEAAPIHTCDTAVTSTPDGRIRCVVYQVGPTCVPEIKVENTGGSGPDPDEVYTFYPMVWQTAIQEEGSQNFGATNLLPGLTPNLNPLRASFFQLFDDATDSPLSRPIPLAGFSSVLVDAPKVLPVEDGFLITAWDLDSPQLVPSPSWYPTGPPGQTTRNVASKGILRIDTSGAQVALWTGTGGEIRDWVIVDDLVLGCHARQLPTSQTNLILYDLSTDAVSESAAVGSGPAGDTIEGGWVGLVGMAAITDDLVMCVANSGATARYTISADSWITQDPLTASGGMRGHIMFSGGGFLQGCGTPSPGGGRLFNGVLCGPPSCVGVVCVAAAGGVAGVWVGVTTQNQSSIPTLAPVIPNAFNSTEIIFEHWFVNAQGEYVADTHNYLLGASPLSRAETDPDSGLPYLYLYAGAKVWPMPAPGRGDTGGVSGTFGASAAYNGTPVLAKWQFYSEGREYDPPRQASAPGAQGDYMAQEYAGGVIGTFDSRNQLEAVFVGAPLSVPFYSTVGNASNHRSALFTGGADRYECVAPTVTAYGEGKGKTYINLDDISYIGVAVTSAFKANRISFTSEAPQVIGTGERVCAGGLYPLECAGAAAAMGAGLPPIAGLTSVTIQLSDVPVDTAVPYRYSLGTSPLPSSAVDEEEIRSAVVGVTYHPSGELIRSEPVFVAGVLSDPLVTGAECLSWKPDDESSAGNGKGAPGDICAGPWPLFGIPPTGVAAVEVYQSRDGQPFELITTKIFPLEESTQPTRNSRADPLRVGYWESGEITPGPAPALVDVVSAGDRVFGLSAEVQTLVYYTKIIRQGYAIEWTRNYTIEFPEPLVAISSLPDGRILGMSERAVYYTYGEGPSDTGQGAGFTLPQVLTLQTGCQAPASIASASRLLSDRARSCADLHWPAL
jgi:hypothetical protein